MGTRFTRRLDNEFRYLNSNEPSSSIRGTQYYGRVVDLRDCGLHSVLYFGHRRSGTHKLEIVGTGEMTLLEIITEIGGVFDLDPMQAAIMRIDLAADIHDRSVEWFRRNARVSLKRYSSEFGRFVSEHAQVQTLYFGKRPNVFRIYNKTEQERIEYRRLNFGRSAEKPIPTFEEKYGHRGDEILTRVERQYGGGRVPKQIADLRRLQENAINFNPFEPLRFLPSPISDESVNRLVGDAFIKGHGILRLIEQLGYHEAKRLMDIKTCRNTGRLFAQLGKLISSDHACKPPDLCGIFREGITRQLATPTRYA